MQKKNYEKGKKYKKKFTNEKEKKNLLKPKRNKKKLHFLEIVFDQV